MKTLKPSVNTKITLEDLSDCINGINSKKIKVTKNRYIKNLLLTNQNLLKSNNINSLILF